MAANICPNCSHVTITFEQDERPVCSFCERELVIKDDSSNMQEDMNED